MATQAERITALEVKVQNLVNAQLQHIAEQHETNKKIDELLALRNKGAGAFWLATTLAGVGALSIFMQILHWFGLGQGVIK